MEDVTDQVVTDITLGGLMPILRCVCGTVFSDGQQYLGGKDFEHWQCPKCGVKLFFRLELRVKKATDE